MEVYRRGDEVAMSGGHGDFELAQWAKTVAPGECFEAPPALVSTVKGDLDSLCQSLVELQTRLAHPEPKHERDLPIIFNEWCSTWGKPTHDYVLRTADRLAETPVRYLVIDDGWAEKPEGADIQFNGYWKVDYNESIGVGCDGAESLGEGLRQHLVQVKAFFEKIRREVPGIVIENCASGGHRLEPGMVALTSMSSFSDAHETVEIPIIAANLHRLIPVHKNQVWAVLRVGDSYQRLCYSLAATFLGRMCVSGDVVQLPDEHFSLFKKAAAFYENAVPVLRDGRTRIFREMGASMRYPTGWQAVIRSKGQTSLVVTHSFEHGLDREVEIRLPGENRNRKVTQSFGGVEAVIRDGMLVLPPMPDFTGAAWLIGP